MGKTKLKQPQEPKVKTSKPTQALREFEVGLPRLGPAGHVFLDGLEVRGITIRAGVNEATVVTLELAARHIKGRVKTGKLVTRAAIKTQPLGKTKLSRRDVARLFNVPVSLLPKARR